VLFYVMQRRLPALSLKRRPSGRERRMSELEDVNRIISETGPLDADILAVVRTGDASWSVHYEQAHVDLEFDAAGDRLLLTATIGAPPEARRAALYETALMYSLLRLQTGGVSMALTGPGGEMAQLVEARASQASPQSLALILGNLVDRTLAWRALFADAEAGEAAALDPAEFAIRV
jgi:hypothetical protein